MASSSKWARVNIPFDEVVEMCARDPNERESDIDSDTGGLSSGEEFELDRQLQNLTDSEEDTRWVFG